MATRISGQGCSLCGGWRPMSAVYSRWALGHVSLWVLLRGSEGGRAVLVMFPFTEGLCAPPCLFVSRLPRLCLGCGSGFLRAGMVTPEQWSRGRGWEKGVWHERLSPPLALPPPFCGSLASARRPLRRRGRGVARFRLPPAVTLPGGGDARAARRHWAGLAEGGAGSARTSRPFLTAADGRGPEEPGRE